MPTMQQRRDAPVIEPELVQPALTRVNGKSWDRMHRNIAVKHILAYGTLSR